MTHHLRIRNPIDRAVRLSGAVVAITAVMLPFVAGCKNDGPVVAADPAPFPPDGVFSITGDGVVSIYWNANWEDDLGGYAVYRSTTNPGPYFYLGEVPTDQTYYDDTDVVNGETWFYAVTAFDRAGNESELSLETVFDTPRPEGTGLVLVELGQDPSRAGYDFSSLSGLPQAAALGTTDIYFESQSGARFLRAKTGVDIQDYGLIDLVYVDWAPDTGWSPSGQAEAIEGHSYIVRILDGQGDFNMAKVQVKAVTTTTATLDWAYQAVENNPELAPITGGAMR
ncbi:MAG TPA: hypothetical protein VFX92_06240 [Candidatus Krumholzibacteria bacterium]|nr:hypothetical protein [Candidatus Krumholzibacteria bacterium]